MSKTALKKELQAFSKEQLIQVIMDAYSARPAIKEYFEYFLNPDPKALYDKFVQAMAKELDRVKRGHMTKARISELRKLIKTFDSYEPGSEWSIRYRQMMVAYAMVNEERIYFTDTLFNGMAAILCQSLEIADKEGTFTETLERVTGMYSSEDYGTEHFRRVLRRAVEGYLSTMNIKR